MKNISLKLAAPLVALLVLLSCGGGGGSGNSPDAGSVTTEDETIILPPPGDGDGDGDDDNGGDSRDQNEHENDGSRPGPTDEPGTEATWRGLTVAPENRCSSYDRERDYRYDSRSVEQAIVHRLGGVVYGPYTGTCFPSTDNTDIEHIVATSEAHDSGLCARDRAARMRFARDIDNLTLAKPELNRYEKRDRDAAEWTPMRNRCWFAGRV
ncbi:MAG: hypothetical protein OXS40_01305, partial [Gammaproteobacteria bacterium]|nr:hypothetical protein [Gammaproteobacteria bacterium]